MSKLLILLCFLAGICFGQKPAVLGPYSTAINIAGDLTATLPCPYGAYGNCASCASRIQFNPPAGYRVKVLHVTGDFIATARSGEIAPGTRSEVGWGLKDSTVDGSTRVTFPGYPSATAYDNTRLWLQGYMTPHADALRLPFDVDLSAGAVLPPDNILISQAFVALDNTGLTYHEEFTGTLTYEFVLQ